MKKFIPALVLTLFAAASLHAAEIGAAAKPLDIKEWIKGSPVKLEDGKDKTVYVVEFWATWCPPCRVSIPHLTELQKKYKDKNVIVIGVSDEKADTVKKFVEQQGDKMDYTVAIDGGATGENYMKAYGARGIPTAFVVAKDGALMWKGHPMDGLDEVLAKVVAGKFDLATAKAEAAKQAEQEKEQTKATEFLQRHMQSGGKTSADELEKNVAALELKSPEAMSLIATVLLAAKDEKLRAPKLGLSLAERANELSGGKDPVILHNYARALFDNGRTEDAVARQKRAIELASNEEMKAAFKKSLEKYEAKPKS